MDNISSDTLTDDQAFSTTTSLRSRYEAVPTPELAIALVTQLAREFEYNVKGYHVTVETERFSTEG